MSHEARGSLKMQAPGLHPKPTEAEYTETLFF